MFWKNAAAPRSREQEFSDIHTHILPGVDDGAPDMPEAMALLRLAYENGTRTVFLTPHYRGQYREFSPDRLREAFSDLCQMAQQEFPDLKLYLGSEIYYEQEAPERLLAGQILTLNGSRYCLLEFRAAVLRSRVIAGVSAIRNSGYIPIISHAERYDIFLKDKTLTDEVLDMGALLQLNADSILKSCGGAVTAFCKRLLKEHKAHFVATDAHDTNRRQPLLQKCFQKIARKYGYTYARELFWENPQAVARNEEI